ncbi:MAG TPA: protein translocase subunit SecF [Candidatus Limnocylindria bacterium]|nr:protein translocase subunit SecF [Candidatus Limnocylindria bacterium]
MIDFLRYRFAIASVSLLILVGALGTYIYKEKTYGQAFKYSIDFTGGTQVLLRFAQPVNIEQLKGVLDQAGWSGAITREFSATEVLVRVRDFVNDANGLGVKIQQALVAAMPENPASILQSEAVGAGVGAELRWNAIMAVLVALLALLVYIALSFWSVAFAVGAVIALAHDALVMLSFYLLFDREISITGIGAILAVLGYSINDTIVIFSSIRSHIKKSHGASLYHVVNASINQTLRRTLLTSFSTLLTVVPMFVLGGEALRDFTLTLLIGIIFGTYSSIYIASPVMMLLYKQKKAA